MNTEIYLDSNATTSILPAARDAALQAMVETYGNPSSTHSAGLRARALTSDARIRAHRVLGVGEGRLIFNSGATEGIQTAVLSALCAVRQKRDLGQAAGTLLVYGASEHKAVPESLAHWNRVLGLNLELRRLAVGRDGRHDLQQLRMLAPNAALVCTMAANNETGAISDLDGIAAALAGTEALWLVDCVQALGKLRLNLAATRIDYAPFSGHKLYAPKGVGMLYVRAGTPFTPLMAGGGQEDGQRAGTENVAGIAALGAVLAELEQGSLFRSMDGMRAQRDKLAAALVASFPGIVFNTPLDNALPTTLNVTVPGVSSSQLLDVLDAAGVRVSAGSACSAAKALPSYVLEAMGLPEWQSANAVRISFGAMVDDATIEEACARIDRCSQALRWSAARGEPASKLADPGAGDPGSEWAHIPDMDLEAGALQALLARLPDTTLVDVRDAAEYFASARTGMFQDAVGVPLPEIVNALPSWLARKQQSPIVFFCRSGRRSEQAARRLRSLGYAASFHLAGGLALAEPLLASKD